MDGPYMLMSLYAPWGRPLNAGGRGFPLGPTRLRPPKNRGTHITWKRGLTLIDNNGSARNVEKQCRQNWFGKKLRKHWKVSTVRLSSAVKIFQYFFRVSGKINFVETEHPPNIPNSSLHDSHCELCFVFLLLFFFFFFLFIYCLCLFRVWSNYYPSKSLGKTKSWSSRELHARPQVLRLKAATFSFDGHVFPLSNNNNSIYICTSSHIVSETC